MRRTTISGHSDGYNRKARKCCTIEVMIHGEKAESIFDRMSSDQEIGECASLAGPGLFSTTANIKLECPASRAPDGFAQIPVHCNSCFPAERIKKGRIPGRSGQKFREDRRRNDKASTPKCGVKGRTRQRVQGIILVPEGHKDVAVNRGGHRPRSSRTHCTTAFLPRPMPWLPMPRYFSKGLLVRTGRTRTE